MLPDPNFLMSEAKLPKEKHIKNPGLAFLFFRRKMDFSVFARRVKNRKIRFSLKKQKSQSSIFNMFFLLGNSTSLTKKLALGNIVHMDFCALTLF